VCKLPCLFDYKSLLPSIWLVKEIDQFSHLQGKIYSTILLERATKSGRINSKVRLWGKAKVCERLIFNFVPLCMHYGNFDKFSELLVETGNLELGLLSTVAIKHP
jgi:hypothetical protein